MNLRNSWLLIMGVLAIFCSASAQESEGILLSTNPSGATVHLFGPYDIVANAPARIPADISGRFRATVTRPGYETWKGEVSFVPGGNNDVEFMLSRKTRLKAAVRSLLIPGWGQRYYGESTRGSLYTAGVVVSAVGAYAMDRYYHKKRSEYNVARSDYYSATSIEERLRLKDVLDDKQRAAYDAETDRRTILVLGAALWTFNILDALLFFPEQDVIYPTVSSLGDGASISLNARF
jgi:hypothetical protein